MQYRQSAPWPFLTTWDEFPDFPFVFLQTELLRNTSEDYIHGQRMEQLCDDRKAELDADPRQGKLKSLPAGKEL